MITRQDIMRRFDDFCVRSGVGWAYARPLDLERATKTGDIDILVARHHIADCIGFFRAQKDIAVTRIMPRVDGSTVFIYSADFGFTHIDLISALHVRGTDFAHVHEMLLRASRDDFWSVLHPVDQAVLLIMTHGVKHAQAPKHDYALFIQDAFKNHDDALSARLLDLVGGACMLDIREAARTGDLSHVDWRSVRMTFLRRGNIVANVTRAVWHALHDVECRFATRKSSIVFLGVDGSGKTTIIQALHRILDGSAHHVRHCRVVPILPWQSEPDSTKAVSNPHARKNRGPIGSIAKVFYLFTRYCLVHAWPWRGSVLFLFDRHMADMVVDPRRYRYGGPTALLMRLLSLLPQPTLSVLVDIDPHIAHRRKPELPLAELRRQADAYRHMMGSLPNPISIKGDDPVQDNINRILRSYLQVMHG